MTTPKEKECCSLCICTHGDRADWREFFQSCQEAKYCHDHDCPNCHSKKEEPKEALEVRWDDHWEGGKKFTCHGPAKCTHPSHAILPQQTLPSKGGWEESFDAEFPFKDWHHMENEVAIARVKSFISEKLEEARREGQMNPKVGFLRRYLNELPAVDKTVGRLWSDEDILRFIRIPFSKESAIEKPI